MPLPPYDVYRDQLTALYYGHALWAPDPNQLYERVKIGDVGYVRDGYFVRMFNVLLPWDDPSNRTTCQPEQYTPLDVGLFWNTKKTRFAKGDYYSRHVNSRDESNPHSASTPDEYVVIVLSRIVTIYTYSYIANFTAYSCSRRYGALLALPYDGLHEDVIRTKVFEDYIRDNIDVWFAIARRDNLDVDRMEEIILVTGCTLVTAWGVAAFIDTSSEPEVWLKAQFTGGAPKFDWRVIRPGVVHQDSYQAPVR